MKANMVILMKTTNRAATLIVILMTVFCVQFAATAATPQSKSQTLNDLFTQLQSAGPDTWQPVEKKIWLQWSKSGSRAMDLLLDRGRAEMEQGDVFGAINHFSALIDHAPEFAEGWNARATAWFVADRYGLSIADIRQTLLLEPRHFGAMSGLGMILERMDQPEDALKIYLEAQKLHPNRPDVNDSIERLQVLVGEVEL